MNPTTVGESPFVSRRKFPSAISGGIDIRDGVPDGLIHVDHPRLGPSCTRIGINYRKAIVDWAEVGRKYRKKQYPVYSGVVIAADDFGRLNDALKEKAQKRRKEVERLPVLVALFTLNRRAKRCRDLAQKYYRDRMFGLAGAMKREKNRIYELKGQVLHHMIEAGVLVGIKKYHRFELGNWGEIVEGNGFIFHRPCPSRDGISEAELLQTLEAKPKGAKEPTLEVAYEVVERFLSGKDRVKVYQWEPVHRQRRRWRDDEEDEDDFDDDGDE